MVHRLFIDFQYFSGAHQMHSMYESWRSMKHVQQVLYWLALYRPRAVRAVGAGRGGAASVDLTRIARGQVTFLCRADRI